MLGNVGKLFFKCICNNSDRAFCAICWVYLITMLCAGESLVSFVKRLQLSCTGKLIPLDGSVIFSETSVVRGREFDDSP